MFSAGTPKRFGQMIASGRRRVVCSPAGASCQKRTYWWWRKRGFLPLLSATTEDDCAFATPANSAMSKVRKK